MSRARLLCLVIAFWLLPVTSTAAPQPITLSDYQQHLDRLYVLIEQAQNRFGTTSDDRLAALRSARDLAGGEWLVETPAGTIPASLGSILVALTEADSETPVGRRILVNALYVLREHQGAAQMMATESPRDDSESRALLKQHLQAMRTHLTWQERVGAWINRLFGLGPRLDTGSWWDQNKNLIRWVGLAVGIAGLALVGRGLNRSLTSYAAGDDLVQGAGRRGLSERAITPDEMRTLARHRSAAGEHQEALRLYNLATLLHLDRLKLLRDLPAQTNREHERRLRRTHPELAQHLNALTDLIESRLYAGLAGTAEDVALAARLTDSLWEEGEQASNRAKATRGASSSA